MSISVDVQWREQYTSHALNRKFAGVIPVGIYRGFDCKISSDGIVTVGSESDESVAVVESNGYSVTVRLDGQERVRITKDKPYVVLDVSYAVGVATLGRLVSSEKPCGRLTLCRGVEEDGEWKDLEVFENKSRASEAQSTITAAIFASAQLDLMRLVVRSDALARNREICCNQCRGGR